MFESRYGRRSTCLDVKVCRAPALKQRPIRSARARGGKAARRGKGESFGGVDYYGSTKEQLYAQAKRFGIRGRSRMDKRELARAIARKQERVHMR